MGDEDPAGPVDPVDRLIEAWIAWDKAPRAEITTRRKMDALAALLPLEDRSRAHEEIAAYRRAGYSVPDAVQSVINDHPPADPPLQRHYRCTNCGHTTTTDRQPDRCERCRTEMKEAA